MFLNLRIARPAGLMLAGALALATDHARAQVDPGAVEREAERQRRQIEQRTAPQRQTGPNVVGPSAAARVEFPPGGATVLLKEVRFEKSTFLSDSDLDAIRKKYVGRKVDLAQIGALVQEVNDLYAARGHITASAILPPQKLNRGILQVKLVEGRLGNLSVSGVRQTRESYVRAGVPPAPGEPVDVPALNRSVALFNRTNEIQLRAQLRAGGQFGLTDIEIAATEPPRNIVQIFGDNQATESNGRHQGGVYWRHHGLFGIDDRFTFYGTVTEGSLYGSGSINLPVTPFGTRAGLSYSKSGYRVINGPLADLRSRGESQNVALNASQPLFASGPFMLLASGSYTFGDSKSDQAGAPVVRSSFQRATGGLTASWTTDRYSFSVAPNMSQVNWKNAIDGTTRDFIVFGGTTTNTVRFTDQIYAQVVGSWQYTREQLLPGDQRFQIGGPTTVRGYPIGVAGGDSGYYGQGELHYTFGEGWRNLDVFAFIDHGAVYSTFPKITRATGAGVGVAWRPTDWATLETSAGFPLMKTSSVQRHHEIYVRLSFRPQFN